MEDIVATLMTDRALQGLLFVVVLFAVFASERLPPVTVAVVAATAMIAFGQVVNGGLIELHRIRGPLSKKPRKIRDQGPR